MTTGPAAADLDGQVAALRHRVDGKVLVPGDEGHAAYGRDAAVIVVAADVGDVVAARRFATASGVEVLLDTDRMADVELDAEERTAWVGAGATWAAVRTAAGAHGLTPSHTVRSFEVVVPDGELVRCCRNEHADLFEALLAGAGVGLGVVTEMEIELVPVSTVDAGDLDNPA